MGMFDTVRFGPGNTVLPPEFTQELQSLVWQTKEMYDCLYVLVVQNDALYYQDETNELHELPYSGSFEIHAWDKEASFSNEYVLSFEKGVLVGLGAQADNYGSLPKISAMMADAQREAQWTEASISWMETLHANRSWAERVTRNLKASKYDFKQAWDHFVRGIKRCLGLPTW